MFATSADMRGTCWNDTAVFFLHSSRLSRLSNSRFKTLESCGRGVCTLLALRAWGCEGASQAEICRFCGEAADLP
eukprot:864193-Amphidinium_carterae.1